MDLAASENFARRPRSLLPTGIRCSAIARAAAGSPARCGTTAAVSVDVSCRSCGARRVFLCESCLEEARWQLEPGLLWCASDGGRITALTESMRLPLALSGALQEGAAGPTAFAGAATRGARPDRSRLAE